MAWPLIALGDVTEQVERMEVVDASKDYRILGMRSQIGGPFLRETKSGNEVSASKLNRVQAGDFIYSRLFAWQGSFGVVPDELDDCCVSNEFPIFRLDEDRVVARFLVFWFGLPQTQRAVEADCFGSTPGTRNRYKEGYFKKLKAPLPPLEEQEQIVYRLEAVAELNGESEKLKTQVINDIHAFIYSLHETFSEHEEEKFEAFIELAEDKVPVEPDGSYPQVGVRGFAGGLFKKDATQGTDTSYKHFNRLASGLFLVSQPKGWEGAVAVCADEFQDWFASPEYRTFKCREGMLHPDYLAALLTTIWFQDELSKLTRGQGARRERLRPEMLLAMKLRMPTFERQLVALQALEKLKSVQADHTSFCTDADALIPAMLQRVFQNNVVA